MDNSEVSQYNDNVPEPTKPVPEASQRHQTSIQPKRALTCAELLEEMKSDTSEEERFREAVRKFEDYEKNRSEISDLHSFTQKDNASSESSSRDSENDSPPDRFLAWDSKGIDLTSLGSKSLKSSFESS